MLFPHGMQDFPKIYVYFMVPFHRAPLSSISDERQTPAVYSLDIELSIFNLQYNYR